MTTWLPTGATVRKGESVAATSLSGETTGGPGDERSAPRPAEWGRGNGRRDRRLGTVPVGQVTAAVAGAARGTGHCAGGGKSQMKRCSPVGRMRGR